ncbi:Tubulin polyglutamylase ttll6 [Entophlyctis sp. JEL0112]|nr:Tubulin polyglutamylase ttll6 [Entophlyctis sp. JEL0112]
MSSVHPVDALHLRVQDRLEGLNPAVLSTARTLYNVAVSRRLLDGVNSTASAAICFAVALKHLTLQVAQPQVSRGCHGHAGVLLHGEEAVVPEGAQADVGGRGSVKLVRVHAARTEQQNKRAGDGVPEAQRLMDLFVSEHDVNSNQAKVLPIAVFYACARAVGEVKCVQKKKGGCFWSEQDEPAQKINETELTSWFAVPTKYFRNVVDAIAREYAAQLDALAGSAAKAVQTPKSRGRAGLGGARSAVAVAAAASSPRDARGGREGSTGRRSAAEVEPATTPSRRRREESSPQRREASSSAVGSPAVNTPEPETPTRKIASAPRSVSATPSSFGKKRQYSLDVDEELAPHPAGITTKRTGFIGRQSMINWQDDAGTSKRCIAAEKWLADMREKIMEKMNSKPLEDGAGVKMSCLHTVHMESERNPDASDQSKEPASAVGSLKSGEQEDQPQTKPPKPARTKKKPTINTVNCKYDVVRDCSVLRGLRVVDDSAAEPWSIFWIDTGVSIQRVLEMLPYQKINHFPGMHEICRKDHLARNLSRISRLLPKDYNFYPKTYVLPHDWLELKAAMKVRRNQTFISKPDHGCQGKGIFLFKSLKAISPHKDTKMIVQTYLNKPCLIDSFKFDLRVYVLVTSVNPLRIFVHRDGLARFATSRYTDPTTAGRDSNLNDVCMHLTNYAINKHSENFDFSNSDDSGSKRSIASVFNRLVARGSLKDPEELWRKIHDAVVKTCIMVQPQLAMIIKACFPNSDGKLDADSASRKLHYFGSQCFEILGFDIFLDRKLKPWVLEVNHSPSFTCDSSLDLEVKRKVILDTLNLLNLNATVRRRFEKVEKERTKSRLFGSSLAASSKAQASAASAKPPLVKSQSAASLIAPSATASSCDETASSGSRAKELPQSAQDLINAYIAMHSKQLLDALTAHEDAHMGSFKRVFPPSEIDETRNQHLLAKYLKVLANAEKLSPDTITSKLRMEHLQQIKVGKESGLRKLEALKRRVLRGTEFDGDMKNVASRFMSWRDKLSSRRPIDENTISGNGDRDAEDHSGRSERPPSTISCTDSSTRHSTGHPCKISADMLSASNINAVKRFLTSNEDIQLHIPTMAKKLAANQASDSRAASPLTVSEFEMLAGKKKSTGNSRGGQANRALTNSFMARPLPIRMQENKSRSRDAVAAVAMVAAAAAAGQVSNSLGRRSQAKTVAGVQGFQQEIVGQRFSLRLDELGLDEK